MFKITKNPTFTHDVEIQVPVNDGYDTQSLKVTYNVLGLDKLSKFQLGLGDIETQRKYVEAIVNKFDDLVDDAGKPLDCTTALREQLINLPYVRVPVIHAYEDALTKAKSKN